MRSLSRQDTYAQIARAARRDPQGTVQKFTAWVADDCRDDLDDALGINSELVDWYSLVIDYFEAYVRSAPHLAKPIGPAYRAFNKYWREKFAATRGRIDGGHKLGTLEHHCWLIYNAHPASITEEWFRRILKRPRKGEH